LSTGQSLGADEVPKVLRWLEFQALNKVQGAGSSEQFSFLNYQYICNRDTARKFPSSTLVKAFSVVFRVMQLGR
jgi:hypothetical protein